VSLNSIVIIKRGKGEVWGPRAKICHGPRATLIGPDHLSVVLVVLMPIAKDQKRAQMTPPVGELLAQPKPAQWNMGAQSQLYPWGPGEPQLSPPLRRQTFYPIPNLYLPAFLELGSRRKLLPSPLPPLHGRPWRRPCLIITIYFK
jgi:hypothetical protein